ncbi:uncharacterized protein LOC119613144 [Lucilia sericata]|uniref:uncharacterized protein LOC119613144 n=1 Tax=Lucilia sericata TaxID=13632 RepID=UPI0018A8455D|nr:uncharacterized protein LOC119613144 [Lucilia sericata]
MWCCSRNTTGIIIGSIYIAACIIYLIFNSMEYDKTFIEFLKSEAIKSIITCSVIILISALYIVAIVKRYQYLIIPWLILGIFIFFITCINVYFLHFDFSFDSFFLLIILLIFGIQIAIFVFSVSLFKEIHEENNIETNQTNESMDRMADKDLL